MNNLKKHFWLNPAILTMIFLASCSSHEKKANSFTGDWPEGVQRIWLGPDYWANRLQDWQVAHGRAECLTAEPNRNINLLTWRLEREDGDFSMQVRTGLLTDTLPQNEQSWIGFRIGARGQFDDYRDDALFGKGLNAGITTAGDLFIGEPSVKANGNAQELLPYLQKGLLLKVSVSMENGQYSIKVEAADPDTGETLASKEEHDIPEQSLYGSIALVSHFAGLKANNFIPSCWFDDWQARGSKLKNYPERAFGPILFNQYTMSRHVVKMTAQMAPLGENDGRTVKLLIREENNWKSMGESGIDPMARTAHFRLEDWRGDADVPYRLVYGLNTGGDELTEYVFEGIIRKEPLDKEEVVMAAFTGNNDLGFPNNDLTKAISYHDPDILFFSGDQIYEGVAGYGVQRSPVDKAALDYLRKWYLYGWEYGFLLKDRPSISIPDDHDVYHGNIWGNGGIATPLGLWGNAAQDAGGYNMPAEWVKMVERTQTSHLPDPYDPRPVAQGIGVYFTGLDYGGVSYAIIEDRKFKSAPKPLLPEAKINNGWPQNINYDVVKNADVPEAKLLGQRQLNFLESWAADWPDGVIMKAVLSQTIFANVATLPKDEHHDRVVPKLRILKKGEYPPDDMPVTDFDSNGWPQSKRDKAIKAFRKGFAVHIAGDQHLGSLIRYGVDGWGDSPYAFCVPAVSNVWPRRWFPMIEGKNRKEGAPGYTGDFLDGFGNKMTVIAVANPVFTGEKPSRLYDRSTGYGIIRFNKKSRDITFECWPRFIDPSSPDAKQYDGWPVTVNQYDNYRPEPAGWLQAVEVAGVENPVVKVYEEENGDLVYAVRIRNNAFEAPIYDMSKTYRMEVGVDGNYKIFEGLTPRNEKGWKKLEVEFK